MRPSLIPYLSLLFFSLLAACSSGPTGEVTQPEVDAATVPDGATDAPAPTDAANDSGPGVSCSGAKKSFASDVQPVLRPCGGEICHGDILPIWRYGELVNVPATRDCVAAGNLVTPGDLEKSYLVRKLTGVGMCPGSERMPLHFQPLSTTDIQTVADWICGGAPND
jgi:hypothetical protein